MTQTVIFDLDGVLLDSEKLYMDMNQKFFKQLGASVSLEEHQTFVGISANKMWERIKERAGLPQSVEQLKEMERELKHQMLKEAELTPSVGLLDFLNRLRARQVTLAIASSGLRKNIDLILTKLNLAPYFDWVVSGEDVSKGKPEPEIFLKVSDHYGRAPGDCVVIEDSTNGVAAAKAAGMVCLAYYNPTSGRQDLSGADMVFKSFRDKELYAALGLGAP